MYTEYTKKLDGVGPVDNRPSTKKLHHSVKKNVTCDTWHMTCDMWHVTCDKWNMSFDMLWGVNILSKFQFLSSFGLYFIISWRLGGEGWLNELYNCRTPDSNSSLDWKSGVALYLGCCRCLLFVRHRPLVRRSVGRSVGRFEDWMMGDLWGSFCLFLPVFARFCPFLAIFGRFWPFLAVFSRFCPFLPIFAYFCPFFAVFARFGRFWPFLAVFARFWPFRPFLAVFGRFWPFLPVFARFGPFWPVLARFCQFLPVFARFCQ